MSQGFTSFPYPANATFASIAFSPSTQGIVGTTTNNNAAAGYVGEFVSSVVLVGSAVSLTSGVTSAITSISLTAGDWDCWCEFWTNAAGATIISRVASTVYTTSAAFPGVPSTDSSTSQANYTSAVASLNFIFANGIARYSLASTTTIYLNANVTFSASTCGGYGKLCARRVR
ncbi:MAG: hypothetical protein KBD83_07440 [Gammaproteobacteria bacterium]|nr:hypothetical protein [Gammaproteobacteria bacterium]